ncbi:hypothetical protein [Jutongia sp.]|uniref:hypothetical protein n=1 Tax=Jutongia sp. TaxID=2944204 RepID=UPI00307AB779
MNSVFHIGLLIMLGICAVMDCMYRRVWMPLTGIMLCYTVIAGLLTKGVLWQGLLFGMGVGVFFYVAAIVTGGQIGKADGILLGILVMAWPPWTGVLFIVYSFLYSFVAAVLLVAIWRKGRNTRMPMVPFMWLGYITVLCL